MKYTNVKAFEKHLHDADRAHLSDVYGVIGKESFEVKSAVDLLIKMLLKSQKNPEFALKVYDGNKFLFEDLMQELHSLPFFSEKRVVLLQNADELSKTETARLEDYFTNPNRTLCFIISASAINRATNFYKKMEKVGIILDIAEEKSWEKEKSSKEWIFARVAKEKKRIGPDVVSMLQKQIGTDLSTLAQEIEKLICYIGERNEITMQDVSAISTSINTETAWQLCDAIFSRNAAHALVVMKGLLDEGVPFLALIRQIRAQVQTDYQICTILSNGGSAQDITAEFPYMKGRILDNHCQAASGYGLSRFKKAMLKIDETESAAKNGLGSDDFLAELLIVALAT
jgi:DNA polymerase-3 subunit delta